jgi:hypothetical protein
VVLRTTGNWSLLKKLMDYEDLLWKSRHALYNPYHHSTERAVSCLVSSSREAKLAHVNRSCIFDSMNSVPYGLFCTRPI